MMVVPWEVHTVFILHPAVPSHQHHNNINIKYQQEQQHIIYHDDAIPINSFICTVMVWLCWAIVVCSVASSFAEGCHLKQGVPSFDGGMAPSNPQPNTRMVMKKIWSMLRYMKFIKITHIPQCRK